MIGLLLDYFWRGPIVAFAVTLVLVLLAASRTRRGAGDRRVPLFAFSVALFVSIGLLWEWPTLSRLPREAMERVHPLLLGAVLLGLFSRGGGGLLQLSVRSLLGGCAGVAFLWNVLRREELPRILLTGAFFALVLCALWSSIEHSGRGSSRARGVTGPLLLVLVVSAAAQALFSTGTAEWAKFGGALAAGIAALGAARYLRPALDPAGAAAPMALLLTLALTAGVEFSELPLLAGLGFVLAVVLPPFVWRANGTRKREVLFVGSGILLAVSALLFAILTHEEFDYSNY